MKIFELGVYLGMIKQKSLNHRVPMKNQIKALFYGTK